MNQPETNAPNAQAPAVPAQVPVAPTPTVEGGQFQIKTLSGKTLCCSLDPNMTIAQVKEHIAQSEHVQVDQQRLVYQGKQLEDKETLGYYQVGDGACLHLILRLR